jgi:hypothetical protein
MSNDIINRRKNNMSNDIEEVKKSILYAIQLYESIDINNRTILLIYLRYVETYLNDIRKNFYYLNSETYFTSEEIFKTI